MALFLRSLQKPLLCTLLAVVFCSFAVIHATWQRTRSNSVRSLPHVVLLGDSNTWIGGDDCSQPRGWNYWFAQSFPHQSIRSYARSGATWTHTPLTTRDETDNTGRLSDKNVVYNQVERLISAHHRGEQPTPNLIIIAAGTNDVWFSKARPQALHNDVAATFAQRESEALHSPIGTWQTLPRALRNNCLLLRRAFPKSRIVLLSPLQSTAFSAAQLDSATQLMAETAQQLHLPLVRQDTVCCLRADDERKARRFSTDGTHTSVEGAARNGKILAKTIGKLWQNSR